MALQAEIISEIQMETKTLLEQWGRWGRENPARSLSFPRIEPYRRLYALPGEMAAPRCYISDNLARAVDKCVAELIRRDSESGEITSLYYLTGCDYITLESMTGINRKRIALLVRAGTAWLDAKIFC